MARLGSARGLETKRFLGKLELMIGFLSLSLATFLLRLETRRLGHNESTQQVLGLLSVMTAGALALVMSRRRKESPLPYPR